MEKSFLFSLIDTSGDSYLFGKSENFHKNVFLNSVSVNDTIKKNNTFKQFQLYKGHELNPFNTEPVARKNISPDWFFLLILVILMVLPGFVFFIVNFFLK